MAFWVLCMFGLSFLTDICIAMSCSEGVTCQSCDQEAMTLTCPNGHVVTGFVEASFRDQSSANWTYCGHLETDCIAEESFILSDIQQCMWHKNQCQFMIDPYFSIPVAPNDCPTGVILKAKYLFASEFECVPTPNIHVLCKSRSRLLTAQNASVTQFLTSVDFPREYVQYRGGDLEDRLCNAEIQAPNGQGIKIWSVYMDIYGTDANGECSTEYLRFSEPGNSSDVIDHVICGQTKIDLVWSSSKMVVHFFTENSIKAKTKRGFALRYDSYPLPLSIGSDKATKPPSTTADVTQSTIITHVYKATSRQIAGSRTNPLPDNIVLIVVVLGCVALVSMVTVLIIFICRRQSRRDSYMTSEAVRHCRETSSVSSLHGSV